MSLANEEAMMLVIPAVRASLSKILKREQGMTQAEIAKRLGTTQAAVSKYISGGYSAKIKRMEQVLTSKGVPDALSKLIKDGADERAISAQIDRLAYRKDLLSAALRLHKGK